jgi:transposase
MVREVDAQAKQMMQRLPSKIAEGDEPPQASKRRARKTPWRNELPQLREDLYRAFGVDLTEAPGIHSLTAQMLLTEIGPNLDRFPTAAAFCSWLRLCPDPKISGGQVLSSRTRPAKNRVALDLRAATQARHRSDCFLADYFRRMKARMGTPKAMTATAHKLVRIIFHMITTRQPYDATIFQKQEERRHHQKSARLHAQARELGFQLVPINFVP